MTVGYISSFLRVSLSILLLNSSSSIILALAGDVSTSIAFFINFLGGGDMVLTETRGFGSDFLNAGSATVCLITWCGFWKDSGKCFLSMTCARRLAATNCLTSSALVIFLILLMSNISPLFLVFCLVCLEFFAVFAFVFVLEFCLVCLEFFAVFAFVFVLEFCLVCLDFFAVFAFVLGFCLV